MRATINLDDDEPGPGIEVGWLVRIFGLNNATELNDQVAMVCFLVQFLEKISNWTEDPDDMIMMPLERLDSVEMTKDLLVQTKVGKAMNEFSKKVATERPQAASKARQLIARWKASYNSWQRGQGDTSDSSRRSNQTAPVQTAPAPKPRQAPAAQAAQAPQAPQAAQAANPASSKTQRRAENQKVKEAGGRCGRCGSYQNLPQLVMSKCEEGSWSLSNQNKTHDAKSG
eukprot:Skav226753  [mRNA]  locus=scaffold3942:91149:92799:- [translate_table: standard]